MARITPSSGSNVDLSELVDDEATKGVLTKPKDGWWTDPSEQYAASGKRLTIDWTLEDEVSTVRDWISVRLGKQQNGNVSKLRMLLNALSDKPRDTEIKWFDDETLEWSYDGKTADNKITEGSEVLFRGVHGTKQDGSDKFTIQKYGSAAAKPAPKAPTKTKTPSKTDEPPF